MATVFRAGGLRVVIFVNDHRPAHVFGDGEAEIDLRGVDGAPVLVWADGRNRAEVRRAMKIVAEQQAFLIERWEFIMAELTDAKSTPPSVPVRPKGRTNRARRAHAMTGSSIGSLST